VSSIGTDQSKCGPDRGKIISSRLLGQYQQARRHLFGLNRSVDLFGSGHAACAIVVIHSGVSWRQWRVEVHALVRVSVRRIKIAMRGPNAIRSIEAARVHHAARRRGSGVALAADVRQPARAPGTTCRSPVFFAAAIVPATVCAIRATAFSRMKEKATGTIAEQYGSEDVGARLGSVTQTIKGGTSCDGFARSL
jgi:hypothetical protein